MLDLELLRTLVCVVDEGSFTRAASRVHRTQSTVSQQVRKLEQAVGKTLLLRDRTGSNVSATEDGELMLAYARRLLAIADEAQQVLSAPRSARVLRLGVPEDFDVARLTVLLAKFSARHPDLRLETVSGMSAGLRERRRRARWIWRWSSANRAMVLAGSMAGSLGMGGRAAHRPRGGVRAAGAVPAGLHLSQAHDLRAGKRRARLACGVPQP